MVDEFVWSRTNLPENAGAVTAEAGRAAEVGPGLGPDAAGAEAAARVEAEVEVQVAAPAEVEIEIMTERAVAPCRNPNPEVNPEAEVAPSPSRDLAQSQHPLRRMVPQKGMRMLNRKNKTEEADVNNAMPEKRKTG